MAGRRARRQVGRSAASSRHDACSTRRAPRECDLDPGGPVLFWNAERRRRRVPQYCPFHPNTYSLTSHTLLPINQWPALARPGPHSNQHPVVRPYLPTSGPFPCTALHCTTRLAHETARRRHGTMRHNAARRCPAACLPTCTMPSLYATAALSVWPISFGSTFGCTHRMYCPRASTVHARPARQRAMWHAHVRMRVVAGQGQRRGRVRHVQGWRPTLIRIRCRRQGVDVGRPQCTQTPTTSLVPGWIQQHRLPL